MSFEKGEGKEHLDKDFLEELKHKIWSTKGSRFRADIRMKELSRYSSLGNSFLSAYLIVFGLITLYNLNNDKIFNEKSLAFSITGLSILSLIFSLVESSKNYSLRAKNYHDCALELSPLYNELQAFKTYKQSTSSKEELEAFANNLQERYQQILVKYENHSPIDNQYFKVEHVDFYKKITRKNVVYIHIKYFIITKLLYLSMIILPPIFIIYILRQ